MSKDVAMILAGGHVSNFGILTEYRPKAALPFAGFYRLIDFGLTNLSLSEISKVGLIIQYQPASLIEHVGFGEWWDLHGVGRLLKILPPFVGHMSTDWFVGTADALYQNRNFLLDQATDNVLILSGEHIYRMDYRPLLAFHKERDADVTIVSKALPPERCSRRFGYLRTNDEQQITEYYEKPDFPPTNTVSTGIYVFKTSVLVEWLERNARQSKGRNLAIDVIPSMIDALRVMAYPFEGKWEYLENLDAYFNAHRRLLLSDGMPDLVEWETMTNMNDRDLSRRVSARIGSDGDVKQSMLSPGVEVEGTVHRSILSPGVIVEPGAMVEDCILLHDVVVRRGARLRRVIADKDTVFGEECEVGAGNLSLTASDEKVHEAPLTVLGKGVHVEARAKAPAGKMIATHYKGEALA